MSRNESLNDPAFRTYLERFRKGEARGSIFRDLILEDAKKSVRGGDLVFLDIGCGRGIENDKEIQKALSRSAAHYIGIEPDADIPFGNWITSQHRCRFEDAPLAPDSIDIAFAFMVLEHISDPQAFWTKLHTVLRRGGIFWGFTVDARHWFVLASMLTEHLAFKSWYLDRLHGARGKGRYENYRVHYKSNRPAQIKNLTREFHDTKILSFSRVGQMDYYLPGTMRRLGRAIDSVSMRTGMPGSNLAVRLEK